MINKLLLVGILAVVVLAGVALIWGMGGGEVTGNISKVERGQYFCEDSDGNLTREESYFVRGSTSRMRIRDDWVQVAEVDECFSNIVKEYYCNHNAVIKFKKFPCPGGCANGACLP
jgi:hypothetical protein